MKKSLYAAAALCLIATAQARPSPDQLGICYVMKDGQVASKQPCIVSSGYGAGGNYTVLSFGGKDYATETVTNGNKETTTLNGAAATTYTRESVFLDIFRPGDPEPESYVWCSKSRYIDLCYALP